MPVTVILGGHWGDEGKGKIVDLLASRCSHNVRYSGGANAGHTVVNDLGSFALHQVPTGVFHDGVTAMLSSGVVLDPGGLLAEMGTLRKRGLALDRLYISERAHVVMPYHLTLDTEMERMRGDAGLGTTGKGIGPAYSDKAARDGLRVGDLLDRDALAGRVGRAVGVANRQLEAMFEAEPFDVDEMVRLCNEWADALAPHICDVEREIQSALRGGQRVLLEGAQGALLDLDAGSYPFVTSSSTGVAGACVSACLPPSAVDSVVAVMHAYMTRVGTGPFPTELHDYAGEHLQTVGNEFGTTTGRARRCGWFDAVASRHAIECNGVTSIALTKLDVMDGLETVKLCVAYEVGGKRLDYLPARASVLFDAKPIYEEMPGWDTPTAEVRRWDDLPANTQAYVRRIEALMDAPVSIVSVGPARDQTLVLRDPLEVA